MERLTLDALAYEADIGPQRVRDLVAIGAIEPGPDGSFEPTDVQRCRLAAAMLSSGITLDQIRLALERREVTFRFVGVFWPPVTRRTGRSFGAFRATLGDRAHLLDAVLVAFGVAVPDPETPMREADEATLTAFLDAWAVAGSEEATVRAARLFGDTTRRAVEGWVDLYLETVTRPLTAQGMRHVDELIPRMVEPASRVIELMPRLQSWLTLRHLERTMTARNVDEFEDRLAELGAAPARRDEPTAVMFVDLTGYTELTEAHGDERATRTAVTLGGLAERVAAEYDGRLVKLLGDGAMLVFDSSRDAVAAALRLVASATDAGLPPAHVGLQVGPVVARDGDYFGHTVNVAARLSGRAGAGEILLTQAAAAAADDPRWTFETRAPLELKGVAEPVPVRVVRSA